MEYQIRPIKSGENALLSDFLYEAIFQRDGDKRIPKSILKQAEMKVYIEDFGKEDDCCLVAVVNDKPIGAVWTRILCGKVKGFGNIDGKTPEFAISLYKEYRGKGIGTQLMFEMLSVMKEKGYRQTALADQKDNYAVKMYQKVGFTIVDEKEEEYIMVCKYNFLCLNVYSL